MKEDDMKIELEISDDLQKFLNEHNAVPVRLDVPKEGDYFVSYYLGHIVQQREYRIEEATGDWVEAPVRLIVEIREPFDLNSIVPDGWRAIGLRQAKKGEWFMGGWGSTKTQRWNPTKSSSHKYIMVERIDD